MSRTDGRLSKATLSFRVQPPTLGLLSIVITSSSGMIKQSDRLLLFHKPLHTTQTKTHEDEACFDFLIYHFKALMIADALKVTNYFCKYLYLMMMMFIWKIRQELPLLKTLRMVDL
jgi:hypothetical protein